MVEGVLRTLVGGLQQGNGLAQIHLQIFDELVSLVQLLTRITGVILDVELGIPLAHINGQRGTVFAARYTEYVSDKGH